MIHKGFRAQNFNPLFPYGKRRFSKKKKGGVQRIFQSTLPIREETSIAVIPAANRRYFNPLFPYGKRRRPRQPQRLAPAFQSTLPIREETVFSLHSLCQLPFQSTLPIREETSTLRINYFKPVHFNPLFPYGKRPISLLVLLIIPKDFNPLFPYGKRLLNRILMHRQVMISIHSSHTGRDATASICNYVMYNFNPLFPYGKRPVCQKSRESRPFLI